MAIDSISSTSTATTRGTQIVKPGNEMDKNAFLRILTAELSNQNPEEAKDSTEYVAQMAQFSALEQMTNLNGTMSFVGASSLVGRSIQLSTLDQDGNPYAGVVKGVVKNGGSINLSVEVEENGNTTIKEFPYEDVLGVE